MIRAAALFLMLAGSATAQGLPAPMQPCLGTHFAPDRYRAELEARGWVFIPPLTRAAQVSALAQTFGPLTVDPTSPTLTSDARVVWKDLAETAMVFDGGGETLLLVGMTPETEGAAYAVRCYVTLGDPSTLDTAFANAPRGVLSAGDAESFTVTMAGPAPDTSLDLTFIRPDPKAAAANDTPAGLATRFHFPAPAG